MEVRFQGVAHAHRRDRSRAQITSRYVATPDGVVRLKYGGWANPTAVFLGGVGEGLSVWNAVLAGVAPFTHAIAYDRLGLGHSGPTRQARDATQIAAELERFLSALGERRPVVLVSHSAGAFYARMFAHLYRGRVAGFVFVEPAHEDWLPELKECDPAAWLRHMQWRNNSRHSAGKKRELAAWDETVAQMRSLGTKLPALPTTVVSAIAGNASATNVLFRLHQRWVAELPGAQHVVTEAGGHYIEQEAPHIVVAAVEKTVEQVRA